MIIPLLNIDNTRHLALCSLSTVTHHGGPTVRIDIAKHADVLTKLMRDLPDDEKVTEFGVVTIAHSVSAVVDSGDTGPANPSVLNSIDILDILETILEAVKRPHSRPRLTLIDHVIELVCFSSMHASKSFKANTPTINFLVAGLRSKDWVTRCTCLSGLLTLYRLIAEDDPPRTPDAEKLIPATRRRHSDHLVNLEMDYRHTHCNIYLALKSTADLQNAMMACMQNYDLYALGVKEAEFILKMEFGTVEDAFKSEDPVTGRDLNQHRAAVQNVFRATPSVRQRNSESDEQTYRTRFC